MTLFFEQQSSDSPATVGQHNSFQILMWHIIILYYHFKMQESVFSTLKYSEFSKNHLAVGISSPFFFVVM